MLEYLLIMGGIWLALFLFQPVIAHMDAIKWCDIKYSGDRARRAETYAQLNALHQQSELYQQMKKEKTAKHSNRKPSPNNHKARRARKRKPLQEAYAAEQRRLAEAEKLKVCKVEVVDP